VSVGGTFLLLAIAVGSFYVYRRCQRGPPLIDVAVTQRPSRKISFAADPTDPSGNSRWSSWMRPSHRARQSVMERDAAQANSRWSRWGRSARADTAVSKRESNVDSNRSQDARPLQQPTNWRDKFRARADAPGKGWSLGASAAPIFKTHGQSTVGTGHRDRGGRSKGHPRVERPRVDSGMVSTAL